MITLLKRSFCALLLCALSLAACQKDKHNSNIKTISFKLKTNAETHSHWGHQITINQAILNLSSFNFELKKGGTAVYSNSFNRLWDYDLLEANNAFWELSFPKAINFDEVEAQLKFTQSVARPALTIKVTISLPGEPPLPIEFYFTDAATLNVNVQNINLNQLKYIGEINFSPEVILSYINQNVLATATKTDGKIIISSTSNVALYSQAKAALDYSYNIDLQ